MEIVSKIDIGCNEERARRRGFLGGTARFFDDGLLRFAGALSVVGLLEVCGVLFGLAKRWTQSVFMSRAARWLAGSL